MRNVVIAMGLSCVVMCLQTPAAGAKAFNGMAFAGPAISGDSVVWGTEYRDGSGAVKVDGRVVTRFERAKGKKRSRGFTGVPGAVSASPTRLGYRLVGTRIIQSKQRFRGAHQHLHPARLDRRRPVRQPARMHHGRQHQHRRRRRHRRARREGRATVRAGVYVDGRKIDTRGESRQVRIAGPVRRLARPAPAAGSPHHGGRPRDRRRHRHLPGPWDAAHGRSSTSTNRAFVAVQGDRLVVFSLSDPRRA